MKLYEFEEYYIKLVLFKLLNNKYVVWTIGIILFFVVSTFAMLAMVYFCLGVNVTLEKFHLEKYKIEKINFLKSEIDLKQFNR